MLLSFDLRSSPIAFSVSFLHNAQTIHYKFRSFHWHTECAFWTFTKQSNHARINHVSTVTQLTVATTNVLQLGPLLYSYREQSQVAIALWLKSEWGLHGWFCSEDRVVVTSHMFLMCTLLMDDGDILSSGPSSTSSGVLSLWASSRSTPKCILPPTLTIHLPVPIGTSHIVSHWSPYTRTKHSYP